VNPFIITGAALDAAGTVCLAVGLVTSSDVRLPLLVTAAPLLLTGVVFVMIGARLGRVLGTSPRIVRTGTPAIATVLNIDGTSVVINNAPVITFDLEVERPEGSTYRASIKQAVPRALAGTVLPGHRVAVRFDEAAPDNLAIDWSVPPAGEEPAPALPEAEDAADTDLLAHGRRGTARITSATDVSAIGGLGLPDCNDQTVLFELEVKLPGRSPFPASVALRVPEHLVGKVRPGLEVEIAADRDDPQHQIAIDWSCLAP
jgi:hypothetical protein